LKMKIKLQQNKSWTDDLLTINSSMYQTFSLILFVLSNTIQDTYSFQ